MKPFVAFCALLLLGCDPSESEVADARARELLAAADPKGFNPASYEEIKRMGPLAKEALVDDLQKNPQRELTKYLLVQIGEHVDFAPLLNDPDPKVRASTLFAIASVADRYAPEILRLMDDDDSEVKVSAYRVAGRDEVFYEKYIEGLASPNPEIRLLSAWRLALIDDPKGLPVLIEFLHHDDPEVVYSAGRKLAFIGTQESVRALKAFRKVAPKSMIEEIDRIIGVAQEEYRWKLRNPRPIRH